MSAIEQIDERLQHFNVHDITRDACMLKGKLREQGYDWWWHSLTGVNEKTGEEKAFFIEFYLINPGLAEDTPVLGQLPMNRTLGKKPSYLMVKAGSWEKDKAQLHRFFAWKDIEVSEGVPFCVRADDCLCSETQLKGSVHVKREEALAHPEWMCDGGDMEWDLAVDKKIAFNVGPGAGKALRDADAFQMYWHAEGMKTEYSGTILYNGEKYIVTPETSYGYADKNWGSDFTSPWVWLSSNCLYSKKTGKQLKNSVFDIGGGRPKIFFVALDRTLLGVMYHEGKEYDFNFSKVPLQVKTEFSFHENDTNVFWHVRQENIHAVMDTNITCKKEDMLFVNYEAPDGEKRYSRLWNGGNGTGTIRLYEKKGSEVSLIDEMEATHVGCEYVEYDK